MSAMDQNDGRSGRLHDRKVIDAMLLASLKEGASIVMDDDDWARIRKSARVAAARIAAARTGDQPERRE